MINPIGKRVLIKPAAIKDTTKSGIVLKDNSINPSFFIGEVLKINKQVESVLPGQTVAYKKYGMEIMEDGDDKVHLVEETSIIAVYE